MTAQEAARQQIAELINKFEWERNRQQSEADVRAGYIDLLFQALGWNVYNDPGQMTNYRREGYVRGAGYVDVGLEIRGQPVLFLEAKRFGLIPVSSQRTGDRTLEEKQAFRYARGQRITYAILTNFERLHLFNADHERLNLAFDHPRDYLDRFEDLWRLSPGAVEGGSLPWWEGQLAKKDIDLEFLAALRHWRLRLANAIYEHSGDNPALQRDGVFDFDRLMEAVQRILNRLILVRYGDDKEVLLEHDLLEKMLADYQGRGAYAGPDHLMRAFVDLSHMMDEHHNTTLFAPGHICEQVTLPNQTLSEVIDAMNRISFRKFTSDILGNTYESYLGTKLTLRNGQIADEERRDIRKGRGIYYTPRWVVEYIVNNTLRERLRELEAEHGLRAIERVRGLAVLDPACGSGSFLIYAYQVLADFYRRMNQAILDEQIKLVADLAAPDMFERLERLKHLPQPVMDYPQVILKEHIFGVDLDPEAAEIAAVNLTMAAFADSRQKKLPLILNENIKVGNSLISGSEEELRPYFGDAWEQKRPFTWEQEFPEIMARGGFDVVIGNPPYVRLGNLPPEERKFFKDKFTSAFGQFDIFVLFIQQGIELLAPGGRLAFIVSNKFLASDYGIEVRKYILEQCALETLVDVSNVPIFKEASIYPCILIVRKEPDTSSRLNTRVLMLPEVSSEEQLVDNQTVQFAVPQNKISQRSGLIIDFGWGNETIWEKVESRGVPLGDICIITRGFRPPPADLVKTAVEVGKLPVKQQKSLRKFVTGRALRKAYSLSWDGKHVIYEVQRIKESKPAAVFERPKVMIRDISYYPEAYYDPDGYYCLKTIYLILNKTESHYDLRYITAILNSKLGYSYFKSRFAAMHMSGGYLRFRKQFLERVPIRVIDFSNPAQKKLHDDLVGLVERMLELHRRKADKSIPQSEQEDIQRGITHTDPEIDNLVYDLYGLTAEERRLVEEGTKG